jgi:hypothetical protein
LTPTASGPWKEKILHSFTGGADGRYPSGTPILDSAGNLYTATFGGGVQNSTCGTYGCGVILKLMPTSTGRWNEHILYSFTYASDGGSPPESSPSTPLATCLEQPAVATESFSS